MNHHRLMLCSFLYALTYNVWADGIRATDNKAVEQTEQVGHKQTKFAGRANNVSQAGAASKNGEFPFYTQESHEKKPLTKDEKRALRKQVNETENMYPKSN
jgi:hypothetical protein